MRKGGMGQLGRKTRRGSGERRDGRRVHHSKHAMGAGGRWARQWLLRGKLTHLISHLCEARRKDRITMDDITQALRESAALKVHLAETQGPMIQAMIECIWESIQEGGKLLLCGNGGSAADAQHLATECMVRLEAERVPLPAIALTTDTSLLTAAGNDYGFETIFARQVARPWPSGRCPPGDQYEWQFTECSACGRGSTPAWVAYAGAARQRWWKT